MEGGQITDLVLPYFEEIRNRFNDSQLNYNIGVYGSRNVCSQVVEEGYADLTFVDGASTGYSGNMGFPMPEQWVFNQIREGVNIDGIQIDNDQVSGRELGFSCLSQNGDVTVINKLPDTGLNNNNAEVANTVHNFLDWILENTINIKGPDLIELFNFDKKTLNLSGGPFYFSDGNCYLKYDSGIKPQIGIGGDLNIYFDIDGFSLDLLNKGGGYNFNPELLNESDFKTKLLSLMPTATSGNCQFYSSWKANQSVELGYFEIEITIPSTKNEELNDNGNWETVKSLAGEYVFIDLILGMKRDLLDDELKLAVNITEEFAIRAFVDILYSIKSASDKEFKIVDGIGNITFETTPKIIEILGYGLLAGILVIVAGGLIMASAE